jgi:hypothetical protein
MIKDPFTHEIIGLAMEAHRALVGSREFGTK